MVQRKCARGKVLPFITCSLSSSASSPSPSLPSHFGTRYWNLVLSRNTYTDRGVDGISFWWKIQSSIVHPFWVRTPLTASIVAAGKFFRQLILEPEDVSNAIVKHILSGNSGQICLPPRYGFVAAVRAFPNWLQELIRNRTTKDLKYLRDNQHLIHAQQTQQQ